MRTHSEPIQQNTCSIFTSRSVWSSNRKTKPLKPQRNEGMIRLAWRGVAYWAKRNLISSAWKIGDEEALNPSRRFRSLSNEGYESTYARLNIYFTEYSDESQVGNQSMELAEPILCGRGISEQDQGAMIIDFRKHGALKLEAAVLRNRNGTSNYCCVMLARQSNENRATTLTSAFMWSRANSNHICDGYSRSWSQWEANMRIWRRRFSMSYLEM